MKCYIYYFFGTYIGILALQGHKNAYYSKSDTRTGCLSNLLQLAADEGVPSPYPTVDAPAPAAA